MRSILAILAIESVAPQVRTVVEVNNPKHVEHFRRAEADEILVTSRLASRLLARTSLYPGLTELVTDIVSGGEGSELYRVTLPEQYMGLSIDDAVGPDALRAPGHPARGHPRWTGARQPAVGLRAATRRRRRRRRRIDRPLAPLHLDPVPAIKR